MVTRVGDIDEIFPPHLGVVFLHAHPDDESFLTAGVLQALCRSGRFVMVVYAAAALVDGFHQTKVRQQEAEAARGLLGDYKVAYLPFCEPKYSVGVPRRLVEVSPGGIARCLTDVVVGAVGSRATCLVSYDRNGGYGNPDHRQLHKAARLAVKRGWMSCHELLEVTICRLAVQRWLVDAAARLPPKDRPKLQYWSSNFGLEEEDIHSSYQLSDDELIRKRLALTAHASQISPNEFPLSLSEPDFRDVFGREYFARVSASAPSAALVV